MGCFDAEEKGKALDLRSYTAGLVVFSAGAV